MSSYITTKKEADPSEYRAENTNRIVYQYKIILLGDISVGKTSILRRFVDNDYSSEYICTVGVEFRIKTILINNKIGADLKIWDTCGEERYRVITRQYYRESNGVLLVFDLTNQVSFEKLKDWYEDVQNNGPKDLHIVLVGNKKDLVDERDVTGEMVNNFLLDHRDIDYIETSALTGEGVQEAFKKLAENLVQWSQEKEKVEKEEEEKETADNYITLKPASVNRTRVAQNNNNTSRCC